MSRLIANLSDLSDWMGASGMRIRRDEIVAFLATIDADPDRPEWGAEHIARWAEYLRHIDVERTVADLALTRHLVACECGAIVGRECPWTGDYALTRLVRYVPPSLRAVAVAGGGGVAQGLARVGQLARCSAECTEEVAHIWLDGVRTVERNPFVEVLAEGGRRR